MTAVMFVRRRPVQAGRHYGYAVCLGIYPV